MMKRGGLHTQPDERVEKESGKIMADCYPILLAAVLVVAVAMMIHDTAFINCLPAIVGGVGSVVFLTARYAMEGILFARGTDERIVAVRMRIKSHSYSFCLCVYLVIGVVYLFLDVPAYVIGGIVASWFIPSLVVTIRLIAKGLTGGGQPRETNKGIRTLARTTTVGAIFFGFLTTWFTGTEGFWQFVLRALLNGALFWVLFFLVYAGLMKLSDKQANKRLAKYEAENKNEGDNKE
jgi:hypothetical protein